MAVTLQQIAEAAGVSRGTVDRALNNRGRIKPDVEERIRRIAGEMGYQKSLAGRALAMAKRRINIGVILQYADTPFMRQVKMGVEAAKTEVEGMGGSVEAFEINGEDPGRTIDLMEEMRAKGFNGIALVPSEDQYLKITIDRYAAEYNIPVVTFNADLEDCGRLCFVGQDTLRSGRTAAGLMGEITGGGGRVAVISGHKFNPGLNNRQKGFASELRASYPGIELLDTRYGYDDDWVSGKIAEELLRVSPEMSGIYIAGPGVRGVCEALKRLGKDRQVKVIANDFLEENIRWLRENTINFLIGQDSYIQGHTPVMLLFRLLFEEKKPEREQNFTEIVIKNKYNI